jgi:glucose uptake protein GlcU
MTDPIIALVGGILMLSLGFLMKAKKGERDYIYILFGLILIVIGMYKMLF